MEWGGLTLGILAGAVFLFLPGGLIACALTRDRALGVAAAPAVSIALYCAISTIFNAANVPLSWMAAFFPALIVGGVACAVILLVRRRQPQRSHGRHAASDEGVAGSAMHDARWWLSDDRLQLAAYIVLGLFFTWFMFLRNLPEPTTFTTGIDNLTHLGYIQSFLDTGMWSFFGVNIYEGESFMPPSGQTGHGFYPSAWHFIAAMIGNAVGIEATEAANACCALFTALVLPTGMLALMRKLFPENPLAVCFGALVCIGFPNMPWKLLSAGPVYPNMASLCIAPSVMALFISFTSIGLRRGSRVIVFVLFCISVLSTVLVQTNAIFTMMVFLMPYCVHQIAHWPLLERGAHGRVKQIVCCVVFLIVFAGVWFFLYQAPALAGVVNFNWPAYQSIPRAIFNYLTLSYWQTLKQGLMALMVIIGFIWAVRKSQTRWIAVSYAIMGVLYVMSSATEGPLKHLLTGFWYTDPMRIAANASLFAMPLAALGLSTACSLIWKLVSRTSRAQRTHNGAVVVNCVVAVVFLAGLLIPNRIYIGKPANPAPLEWVSMGIGVDYGLGANVAYDATEIAFVDEVKELIGEEPLVINDPADGSVFAYGVNDLNAYYRYYSDISGTEDADAIRLNLKDIATDERVRSVVDEIGAEYVLQLDQPTGDEELSTLSPFTKRESWEGVDAITDETPGFELVLSDRDMRLYRILPAEEVSGR